MEIDIIRINIIFYLKAIVLLFHVIAGCVVSQIKLRLGL